MTTLFDFPYGVSHAFFDNNFSNALFENKHSYLNQKDDGSYLLEIEVPGYSKENINLSIKEGKLYVNANREGKSTKSFVYKLSNKINTKNISASCKDGVLTVTLPLKEPEQITVNID
jgi:HSP20 family protein